MLRKLIMSWVVAISAALWLSATPLGAAAGEPIQIQFQVLIQDESGWHNRGTYSLRSDARQIALRLWQDGHRVLIQEVISGGEK